jgi:hypothetical protein
MRIILITGLTALALCVPTTHASAQLLEASFSFVSDPGDYIGAGQSRSFTLDTASITVRGQDGGYVGLTLFPFEGGFWFLDLAAPLGTQLVPGAYENASRWPFHSPTQPGLSVSGDGRGCNTLTGRFDVLESKFGPNGYVESFHAMFEQHCEGAAAALRGEVRIVNSPPPPALEIQLSVNRRASVDRITGNVRVSGTLSCTVPVTASIQAVLRQRLNRFSLATSSVALSGACSPTPAQWSAELTPVGNVPFGSGMAEIDVEASAFDPNYSVFVRIPVTAAVSINAAGNN